MFCLTPSAVELLKGKFKSGEITPEKLNDMDSEQRHGYFASFLGEPTATKVNELIESKLLLKNQQQGLITAAQQLFGDRPQALRDVVSKINRMEKLLTPENSDKFMADLAAHKIGGPVTLEQTAKLFDLSNEAKSSREELQKDPFNKEKMVDYGNKLLNTIEYADSLKPKGSIFSFSNIWNLPNSALTSVLHFSAPFVQNWGMVSTKQFYQGFPKMFEYFAKEQSYKDLNAFIVAHPDYNLAVDGKLGITKLGDKLTLREEAIQSSLLEHVPGLGKIIKASSRTFTGYLNYVRFSRFTQLLDAARLNGEDVSKGSSVVRDLAKVVNDFTGRGALGKNDQWAQSAKVLNNIFFTPRGLSATMQMFNPIRYVDPRISPTAKKAATRQILGSLLATGAVLGLARSMGASINMNPVDKDFAKIKFGHTTFNPAGRNESYIRFLARMATNTKTNSEGITKELGEGYGSATKADVAISFLRAKLAPLASAIADSFWGKDMAGHKFNLVGEHGEPAQDTEAFGKLVPITMQEFYNILQNDPHNAAAYIGSLAAVFGVQEEAEEPHQWDPSSGKELKQFYDSVGKEDFQKANNEYNSRLENRIEEVKKSQEYKDLPEDRKLDFMKNEKANIKKDIFQEYDFHYRRDKKEKLPTIEGE